MAGLLDTLFLVQMFPTTLALIALYSVFDSMGDISPLIGIDSHAALVLVYLVYVIWLFVQP